MHNLLINLINNKLFNNKINKFYIEKDAWLVEWNPLKFAIFKFRVGVGFHSIVVWSRWCRTASS